MIPSLPAETVTRRPPLGLLSSDSGLFQHEFILTLGPTVAKTLDVDFLPQGLLTRPGRAQLVAEGFQNGKLVGLGKWKTGLRAWEARLLFPRTEFRPEQGRAPLVITDEFSNGFFHWVGDALPKLAWLAGDLGRFELVLPTYARRFPYMEESLALWPDLRWTVATPRTRTALKDALVVPALAPTGNYRPALMQRLGDQWRQRVRPHQPHRQVYVSRAKAPWRKIRNEDAVWTALSTQGFERVFLEDLAFADQVKLAAEARVLVSNHGAGLSVAAFMVPGTRLLEIRLEGDAHNNCYYSLANAVGLDYSYLVAPPADSGRDVHTADLVVDVPALLRTLEVPA